jgi:type I restriction enzyme M protein
VKLEAIRKQGHILTPGRYIGSEEESEDGECFEEKMKSLLKELDKQFSESKELEATIKQNIKRFGFNE